MKEPEIILTAGCYSLAVDVNGPTPMFIVMCDDIRGITSVIGRYIGKKDALDRINKEKSTDEKGGVSIPLEESLLDLSIHYPRAGG